jgi:rhodanese-related sulfurtransferase
MPNVNVISTEELKARLDRDGKFEFWNVLTDEYFKGEFIPDSRRVALDQIGREVSDSSLPKDTEIITYCNGPSCPQSSQAAEKLLNLGYTNVRAYEGGLEEWKAAGLSVETLEGSSATAA